MTSSDIEISKEEIRSYQRSKLLVKIRELKDKNKVLEQKYGMNLEEFERMLETKEENFELFDLSIEWKALIAEIKELEEQLIEVENAKSFRITE